LPLQTGMVMAQPLPRTRRYGTNGQRYLLRSTCDLQLVRYDQVQSPSARTRATTAALTAEW
jgi:hypothetical protein